MNYIIKNWIFLLFALSLIAIITALTAEYFFDLAPCKMCLKQRHPYYAIILLILFFYFIQQLRKLLLSILNEVAVLYGLFYALWHVGIEQKILPGPASCSGTLSNTTSIQNLKEQINNQAIVNCTDITWTIIGFSAASINSILLLLILIFNSIYIVQSFYGSKKIS
jgi:disulfide bond formation protein DsbB|tara:strand:- start:718 stop:1215 length:498 start_codon:yes stop_codon:yes gene_type:complete